jgi:hypothetical protein
MSFAWASQKHNYTGRLQVNSWGNVGNNAPASRQIATNHTTITYVDCGVLDLRFKETMQGNASVLTQSSSGNFFTQGTAFYCVPWQAGYAARTQIGTLRSRFVTPKLNGCAVFIGGTRASPVVVHANAQATALLTPAMGDDHTYFRLWDDVYTSLASKLVSLQLVPSAGFGALMPSDYMKPGVSGAGVFGVRDGSDWSFYVTENGVATGSTRRFWPA